ncbi:hypothetical protein Q8F57_044610 [Paraburkholderia terrae]|nr:hypothetical protein [Paraburkholderia terrae]MDW3659803.1 hypothetical protein [Paraburkholderia terrae]
MKFDLILAVDDGDGQVTNISLGQVGVVVLFVVRHVSPSAAR